jgi:hypothetical protein
MKIFMTSRKLTVALLSAAAAAALLATASLIAQPAAAKPEFTAQTKLPCGQCHVNPAGGDALKPFGQKFKQSGFKAE